jgi:putative membrane protein
MITYNPKDWFKLLFDFHKSDTFRILAPTMLLLGILTTATCYFTNLFFPNYHPTLTLFHQISGFVISMVLVFRINTAYDRWWEGRKQWGALVNSARNLAIKFSTLIPDDQKLLRQEVYGLIASFPFVLKEHLRSNSEPADIIYGEWLQEQALHKWSHQPNYMVSQLSQLSRRVCSKYNASTNDYLILSESLTQFTDVCGACERIRSTPIPFSYSIFIKRIIFLYIITMPLAFGVSIGYWSVPMVMILFYAFTSLELISEEIEDPFGTDENDLPTDEIAVRIRLHTKEILIGHEA